MTKSLTLLEFTSCEDFSRAHKMCRDLGYSDSYAYTTSSDIPGLYCLPLRPSQHEKIIVKTLEFGFIALEILE